jgi:preprotein translocase subunit SecA
MFNNLNFKTMNKKTKLSKREEYKCILMENNPNDFDYELLLDSMSTDQLKSMVTGETVTIGDDVFVGEFIEYDEYD